MKESLVTEFNETTKGLFETLSLFTQEEFNKIPFPGSWTAGQVAEHLWKSESAITKALKGASNETERNPQQHVEMIRKVFLDFTTKLKSPEFILPSDDVKDKEAFIKAFQETRDDLKNSIETLDLDKTFIEFSFPQAGNLTGWELFNLVVCHTKRHTRQLKMIAEKLKGIAA